MALASKKRKERRKEEKQELLTKIKWKKMTAGSKDCNLLRAPNPQKHMTVDNVL